MLGGYTPSESTDDPHPTITSGPGSASTDDDDDEELKAILAERAAAAAEAAKPSPTPKSARDELFPSALRARNANVTLSVPTQDTAQTTASSTSAPLTDALMTHHRTEQEALTESLVQMAKALKESSKNFSLSLEEEKEIVARAGEGLDRNTSGLEQASRRIGYLRRMSEGKGWWGRIMLYVWIAGLAFLAFFIVAFMPKLRF